MFNADPNCPPPTETDDPTCHVDYGHGGKIALGLGLLVIVYAFLALWLIADAWSKQPRFLEFLLGDPGRHSISDYQLLIYTMGGAVIGSALICLKGLHHYAAVKRTFHPSYIGGYVLGPIGSAILGVAIFALVRGGLLVFSVEPSQPSPLSAQSPQVCEVIRDMAGQADTASGIVGKQDAQCQNLLRALGLNANPVNQRTQLAYLALGVLTGFGWRRVGVKIEEVVETIFSTQRSYTSARPPSQGSGVSPTPPDNAPIAPSQNPNLEDEDRNGPDGGGPPDDPADPQNRNR